MVKNVRIAIFCFVLLSVVLGDKGVGVNINLYVLDGTITEATYEDGPMGSGFCNIEDDGNKMVMHGIGVSGKYYWLEFGCKIQIAWSDGSYCSLRPHYKMESTLVFYKFNWNQQGNCYGVNWSRSASEYRKDYSISG